MTDRERLESVLDRRVFPTVPIEFTLAWELLSVAQEIVVAFTARGNVNAGDPAYRRAALGLFARLYDDYLGTLHLAGQGLGIQAGVVLRSLTDSFYWFGYIMVDEEKRAQRGLEYLAAGWNSLKRDVPKAEQEGIEIPAALRAEIERQAARFPDARPKKPERLARAAGLSDHHRQGYVPLSAIAHGEARGFLLALGADGQMLIGPRRDQWLLQIVRLAFSDFRAAARLFVELFELGHEM